MRRFVKLAVGAVVFGLGCSSSTSPSSGGTPGADQVWMQSSAFNPASRRVAVGTLVTWMNKDGTTHTVTSNLVPAGAATFSSGAVAGGGQFQVMFATAGTYQYYCTIHGSPGTGMHGTVVVQ